ncbi:hypothetical protein [Allomuricauda sp. NBRC 101325]|uniref:hypothetical protein n=1 Tax=Allomuricauda sp. NBRC 101325 TaxID=1113758 RepID=UPI0024A2FE5D|nr:hypothetical protein [Muricauda sp. NBRC 101325]GLU45226.1 hypothetical protein Musp01_28500 [Muricauda sp. NBRC 101325]
MINFNRNYNCTLLKLSIILLILVSSEHCYGQQDDGQTISYVDKLAYGIDFSSDFSEFLVHNNDMDFHLITNNDVKMTLRMNYKFLNLSYGFAAGFLPGNDDDDLKGESKFTEYKVNMFLGQFVQNLFFDE